MDTGKRFNRHTIITVSVTLLLVAMIVIAAFVALGGPLRQMFENAVGTQTMGQNQAALCAGIYGGGPEMRGPSSGGTAIPNGKAYDLTFFENYGVNPFVSTEDERFSTFGMDVDNASYTIARRFITDGNLPEKDAVRTEEFINYFKQDYPRAEGDFRISIDGAKSIFGGPRYHLVRIGISSGEVTLAERPAANLIFVVDVSGSMEAEHRLGQVKKSLRMLAENLKPGDRVGLVVYGSQGRVLSELTPDRDKILAAIEQLIPEGSTNAEEGLKLAYDMARRNHERGKINRIILCSDGVANVGNTGADVILKQIKSDAKKGITLTCLGFGMGNYNDVLLEKLANHGDGNYHYIDSAEEAARLFANGAVSLLHVVASDAKIQVEFNPNTVDRYRLLGYENRALTTEQFRDDSVDAGEVGAGQTVTALYEIRIKDASLADPAAKIATVRIRYQDIETRQAHEAAAEVTVGEVARDFNAASPRFRFIAAVAEYAEILKESYWAKDGSLARVLEVVDGSIGELGGGTDESEFRDLVKRTIELKKTAGERKPSPAKDSTAARPAPGNIY